MTDFLERSEIHMSSASRSVTAFIVAGAVIAVAGLAAIVKSMLPSGCSDVTCDLTGTIWGTAGWLAVLAGGVVIAVGVTRRIQALNAYDMTEAVRSVRVDDF